MFSKFDKEHNDATNREASAVGLLWKVVRGGYGQATKQCVERWKANCSSLIISRENKQLVKLLLGEEVLPIDLDERVKSRYDALMARPLIGKTTTRIVREYRRKRKI